MIRRFVRSSGLIFDLGMNNGDDTEYYLLKARRVVSVEANSDLCALAQDRFAAAIETGRLDICNLAVWNDFDTRTFFINTDNDHWSSLDIDWAGREQSTCAERTVKCVPVSYLFALYGVPFYMKIDVEGVDQIVIDQLRDSNYLPYFLSLEDCRFGYDYLETLKAVGYERFKLANQADVANMTDESVAHRFKPGASGPFGDDLPGEWLGYDDMVSKYSCEVRDRDNNRHAPRTIWWDIHCCGPSAGNVL